MIHDFKVLLWSRVSIEFLLLLILLSNHSHLEYLLLISVVIFMHFDIVHIRIRIIGILCNRLTWLHSRLWNLSVWLFFNRFLADEAWLLNLLIFVVVIVRNNVIIAGSEEMLDFVVVLVVFAA